MLGRGLARLLSRVLARLKGRDTYPGRLPSRVLDGLLSRVLDWLLSRVLAGHIVRDTFPGGLLGRLLARLMGKMMARPCVGSCGASNQDMSWSLGQELRSWWRAALED